MTVAPKDIWSPAQYNKAASFVYSDSNTQAVFDLLAPQQGERILDMGCGTGELTFRLQEIAGEDGVVVGVDASRNMLEKAKENGVRNLFCCDLQELVIPEELKHLSGTFDAVFSNATLHWCKRDPLAVVKAAKTNLRPGGRFVGEFAGHLSAVGLRTALYQVLRNRGIDPEKVDPWYHPRPERYAKVLESGGFKVEHVSLIPRITPLPGPYTDFLRTFFRSTALGMMDDEEAEIAMQEISDLCEPDLKDDTGRWTVMYMSLRFLATASA